MAIKSPVEYVEKIYGQPYLSDILANETLKTLSIKCVAALVIAIITGNILKRLLKLDKGITYPIAVLIWLVVLLATVYYL